METRGSCPTGWNSQQTCLVTQNQSGSMSSCDFLWLRGTTCFPVLLPSCWHTLPGCCAHLCVFPEPGAHLDPFICALLFWREVWLSFVQVALKSPCARSSICSSVCGLVGIDTGFQDQCTTTPTTRNLSGSFTGSSPELLWSLGPRASPLRPVFSWRLGLLFGMDSWEFRVHQHSQLLACFLFCFLPNSTISIGKEMEKLTLFLKPFYVLPGYLDIFQNDFDFVDCSFQFSKNQHKVILAPCF